MRDISEAGLVYTFRLRKGVKFHNGEAFKVDDVAYTVESVLIHQVGADSTHAVLIQRKFVKQKNQN